MPLKNYKLLNIIQKYVDVKPDQILGISILPLDPHQTAILFEGENLRAGLDYPVQAFVQGQREDIDNGSNIPGFNFWTEDFVFFTLHDYDRDCFKIHHIRRNPSSDSPLNLIV